MDGTILVADDDRTIRTVLTQALTRAGCKVRATGSVNTLWRWIEEGEGDVVISDVNFPDGDGLEMLPAIKRKRSDLPVIIISAQNTVITAIKSSELGAYDYLPKPFDLKDLLSKVSKALSTKGAQTPKLEIEGAGNADLPLIGSAPVMQEVYRLLARVLNTDLSVMIVGESGTGKDLLAKTLHKMGHRSAEAYTTISTASVTPEMLEQTFLECEDNDHTAQAGATIYLDDVSEMSAPAQLKLLELFHLDTVKSKNFRFISSTSKSLENLVNDGSFREDLFYRLNVVPIILPPLRERLGDIAELTHHFLQKIATNGVPLKTISAAGIELMRAAPWVGNVRELENFITRMVILTPEDDLTDTYVAESLKQIPHARTNEGFVENDRLSSSVESHIRRYFELHGDELPPPGLYNRILKEVEMPLIALSLSATRGNQIKTADLLGINRNTLRKKINELDIHVTRSKKMM